MNTNDYIDLHRQLSMLMDLNEAMIKQLQVENDNLECYTEDALKQNIKDGGILNQRLRICFDLPQVDV